MQSLFATTSQQHSSSTGDLSSDRQQIAQPSSQPSSRLSYGTSAGNARASGLARSRSALAQPTQTPGLTQPRPSSALAHPQASHSGAGPSALPSSSQRSLARPKTGLSQPSATSTTRTSHVARPASSTQIGTARGGSRLARPAGSSQLPGSSAIAGSTGAAVPRTTASRLPAARCAMK